MSREERPIRERLRELPVFPDQQLNFDTDAAPSEPYQLMLTWLDEAIDADVSQPHAMTLATAAVDGQPSARTLLLKDIVPAADVPAADEGQDGVWFATLRDSPKGIELAENPHAALVFYWREQGRQIRVSGRVEQGAREVSESDFLARGFNGRAGALTGEQSRPMPGDDDVRRSLQASREFLAGNPLFVPATWVAYRVIPDSVEFWQATANREQVRLQYRRTATGDWERHRLWP